MHRGIAVETHGTIDSAALRRCDHICLSPKRGTAWQKLGRAHEDRDLEAPFPWTDFAQNLQGPRTAIILVLGVANFRRARQPGPRALVVPPFLLPSLRDLERDQVLPRLAATEDAIRLLEGRRIDFPGGSKWRHLGNGIGGVWK